MRKTAGQVVMKRRSLVNHHGESSAFATLTASRAIRAHLCVRIDDPLRQAKSWGAAKLETPMTCDGYGPTLTSAGPAPCNGAGSTRFYRLAICAHLDSGKFLEGADVLRSGSTNIAAMRFMWMLEKLGQPDEHCPAGRARTKANQYNPSG